MSKRLSLLFLAAIAALLLGCGGDDAPQGTPTPDAPGVPEAPRASGPEPEHISVDHILIGVKNPKFTEGKYTAAKAKEIAYDLVMRLKNGAEWSALKEEYSDDRGPGRPPGGPYPMANRGVRPAPGETPRDRMVAAFGNVGFTLDVGGIGVADYDPQTSPFGFHIIKRVK